MEYEEELLGRLVDQRSIEYSDNGTFTVTETGRDDQLMHSLIAVGAPIDDTEVLAPGVCDCSCPNCQACKYIELGQNEH